MGQYLCQNLLSRDTFGLTREAQQETMAQSGQHHVMNVLLADVESAAHESPRFGGDDQALRTPRACPQTDVVVDHIRSLRLAWMGGEYDPNGQVTQMTRDGNLANQLLELLQL